MDGRRVVVPAIVGIIENIDLGRPEKIAAGVLVRRQPESRPSAPARWLPHPSFEISEIEGRERTDQTRIILVVLFRADPGNQIEDAVLYDVVVAVSVPLLLAVLRQVIERFVGIREAGGPLRAV